MRKGANKLPINLVRVVDVIVELFEIEVFGFDGFDQFKLTGVQNEVIR